MEPLHRTVQNVWHWGRRNPLPGEDKKDILLRMEEDYNRSFIVICNCAYLKNARHQVVLVTSFQYLAWIPPSIQILLWPLPTLTRATSEMGSSHKTSLPPPPWYHVPQYSFLIKKYADLNLWHVEFCIFKIINVLSSKFCSNISKFSLPKIKILHCYHQNISL